MTLSLNSQGGIILSPFLCTENPLPLTPLEQLPSYCIIISFHIFFPLLGLYLLKAEVYPFILRSQHEAQL